MSSSKRRRRARQAGSPSPSKGFQPESLAAASAPEMPTYTNREPSPPTHDFERIGDILRRSREQRGEDIDYISDYLRIRPGFLSALENSRYEEFPADAYVIGFLRSYANYLGLDGRAAIDHYRHEMAGRRRRPSLNMPQPISEGRTPTVAILIGAFLAAVLIYALWYALSSSDRAAVSALPVLPQTATAAEAEPNKTAAVVASLPIAAATSSTATLLAMASATTESNTVAPTATPENSALANTATNETTVANTATNSDKQTAIAKTEELKGIATEEPMGKIFGDTTATKPRVVLQADNESWILVTDSHGITVFDRVLKPGEAYIVPTTKGLSLTTGNAAGLILKVDGVELPRIVSSSRVVRAVPLDPEKLKGQQRPSTE